MAKNKKTRKKKVSNSLIRASIRKREGLLVKKMINYFLCDEEEQKAFFIATQDFCCGCVNEDELSIYLDNVIVQWTLFNWSEGFVISKEPDLLPEVTIAEDFLYEEEDTLSSKDIRFIEAALEAPFSVYQVIERKHGETLKLKCLFSNKEYIVLEKSLSKQEVDGNLIFARVIYFDEVHVMFGCIPNSLPASSALVFIDLKQKFEQDFKDNSKLSLEDDDCLMQLDQIIRPVFLNQVYTLRQGPILNNTDGHKMQINSLNFKLNCTQDEALNILGKIKEIDCSDPKEIIWLVDGKKKDEQILYASLELKYPFLRITTNSLERSEFVKEKIINFFKEKIVFQLQDIDSSNLSNFTALANNKDGAPVELPADLQEVIEAQFEEHWKTWPDTKLPALNGKTPREALTDKDSREKLEALLFSFDESNKKVKDEFNRIPVVELRKSLGL